MNYFDQLKLRLKSLKINTEVLKKSNRNITKQELEKDAKKVSKTFSDEDIQPRLSAI